MFLVNLLNGLAGLAALFYLAAPILIRFSQKMAAEPVFKPMGPADYPAPVAEYMTATTYALAPDGFIVSARAVLPDQMPGVVPFLVMLENRARGDKAMVTVIFTTNTPTPRVGTKYLEFSTRYADGRSVDTLNSTSLNSFIPSAQEKKAQLPGVEDARLLYRVHQHLMRSFAPDGEKILYEAGGALSYLRRVMVESYEQQVAAGMLYRDGAVYRPTWKGAYLMTWGLLWPVSSFRRAKIQQEAQSLLQAVQGQER